MTESPYIAPEPLCPLAHITEVDPCPDEELDPLIDWLRSGVAIEEPRAFVRGTALPDGRLDCCKQALGVEGARRLIAALPSQPLVRHVLLGTDGLGDVGAAALAEHIDDHDDLETVYLGCNVIGHAGARALAEAIEGSRHVRALWLKRNPLGVDGARAIAEMLPRNTSLRTLDLVNCQLGEEGVALVAEALEHNSSVRHLYLGANGIGVEGARALSRLLAANAHLRSLFLSINWLGDRGTEILAQGLAYSRLEVLSLSSNDIGPGALDALLDALDHGGSLHSLSFGRAVATEALGHRTNRLGDRGAARLAAWLSDDPPLRRLLLDHNLISSRGALALEEGLTHNRHLQTITLGRGIARRVKRRIRVILDRNAARQGPLAIPDDVLSIRSVYRTNPFDAET